MLIASRTRVLQNADPTPFPWPIGSPVASSGGDAILADANDAARRPAVGLVINFEQYGFRSVVIFEGFVEINDWTPIIGAVNLSVGSTYYLSETIGQLTTVEPTFSQTLGIAVSGTVLQLTLNPEFVVIGSSISGDLDGGFPDSVYGGVDPIDGGTP